MKAKAILLSLGTMILFSGLPACMGKRSAKDWSKVRQLGISTKTRMFVLCVD